MSEEDLYPNGRETCSTGAPEGERSDGKGKSTTYLEAMVALARINVRTLRALDEAQATLAAVQRERDEARARVCDLETQRRIEIERAEFWALKESEAQTEAVRLSDCGSPDKKFCGNCVACLKAQLRGAKFGMAEAQAEAESYEEAVGVLKVYAEVDICSNFDDRGTCAPERPCICCLARAAVAKAVSP